MSVFAQSPLAEVCTIVGGGTPRRSNATYFGGPIPWATPTDVTSLDSLFIERTKEAITEVALNKSSARMIPAGTVLMTSRATIGYTAISTRPMATNQGFANLICGDLVLPEYLAYWLRDQRGRLIELAGGTTFREITKSTLKKVCIPLPSLDEQRRIVAILNRAAKIKQLRAQSRKLMREFIPALFAKMFGDAGQIDRRFPCRPLQEVSEIASGATKGRKIDPADCVRVPYLRVANVQDGYLDLREVKNIEIRIGEKQKYALAVGDLVMTEGGNLHTLGRAAVWDGQLDYCAHQNHVFRVRPRWDVVLTDYLRDAAGSEYGKSYFLSVAKRTTIANINKTQLGGFPVPLPPLDLQAQYGRLARRVHGLFLQEEVAGTKVLKLSASIMERLLSSDGTRGLGSETSRRVWTGSAGAN